MREISEIMIATTLDVTARSEEEVRALIDSLPTCCERCPHYRFSFVSDAYCIGCKHAY
jgi:hypothetical protein